MSRMHRSPGWGPDIFGWKNFFTKDSPMLSPQQTMTKTPAPVMISYQ